MDHNESTPVRRFLRRDLAAKYVTENWGFNCSRQWLAKLAVVGGGPLYRKAGRVPLYALADLDAWAQSRMGALRLSSGVLAEDGEQARNGKDA